MDFSSLLVTVGSVTTPTAFFAAAPDAAEMLRIVLFLAAIVGCGSIVVGLVSRDGR